MKNIEKTIAEAETAIQLENESDTSQILDEIATARIESFLQNSETKSTQPQGQDSKEEHQSAAKISTILSEIKADFSEVFENQSEDSISENMQILNTLITQSRKLDPEHDWTGDLPFFLEKIKTNKTVSL